MIELRSYSDWRHEVVDVRADGDWPIAVCECFDDALRFAADAGMHPLAVAAHRIARHTPAGIYDKDSLHKLETEERELAEACRHADRAECLTELADVGYYAGKCIVNGMLTEEEAEQRVIAAARSVFPDPDAPGIAVDHCVPVAIALAEAKYAARRAAGRKDAEAERLACARVARERGLPA